MKTKSVSPSFIRLTLRGRHKMDFTVGYFASSRVGNITLANIIYSFLPYHRRLFLWFLATSEKTFFYLGRVLSSSFRSYIVFVSSTCCCLMYFYLSLFAILVCISLQRIYIIIASRDNSLLITPVVSWRETLSNQKASDLQI